MKLIDTYEFKGEGYNPFLISNGWQVAKLNYLPEHALNVISDIEVHKQTDEAFVLFKGTGILIGADFVQQDKLSFEVVRMKPGILYNLPKGRWHNIAMTTDAEMFIVEANNTHLNDCEHKTLTDTECIELNQLIAEQLSL